MDEFLRRLKFYFRRRSFEADLEEEMQHHVAMSGRPQFGNVALLREDSRSMWTWTWVEQFAQDLRYAFRSMLANKAFTTLAVASLALGIGANTAIFSFVDSILLRALPVEDPSRLVILGWHSRDVPAVVRGGSWNTYKDPGIGFNTGHFPYPALDLFRQNNSVFESLFAYRRDGPLNVVIRGQADLVSVNYVTGDYFRGLGLASVLGRFVEADDDRPGAASVVVISHRLWQNRFGSATDVLGQTVTLNRQPLTIIGVAPREFYGVNPGELPDLYLPLHASELVSEPNTSMARADKYTIRGFYWLEMMARLKPGVSREQAEAALEARFHQFVDSTARNDKERADLPVFMLQDGGGGLASLRRQYSRSLYILMGLVGLILAIACANLANLLLARAASRRREMAVRVSVGAGRWRVVRQLLTESVLMSAVGGVAGIAVGVWGIQFLKRFLAGGRTDITLPAELNWTVLAVAVALSILTGVLFGLAPAIQATRVDLIPALKEARSTQGRSRSFLGISLSQMLVVFQIALSLLIVAAAGLFVRTLVNYNAVEVGFNRQNVLLFTVNALQAGYSNNFNTQDPSLDRFYANVRQELTAIPGVRSVSFSDSALVSGSMNRHSYTIPGPTQQPARSIWTLSVGPAFFSTMEIPILLGREIGEGDTHEAPYVAVVNEKLAKAYFGNENPIGRVIQQDQTKFEIVGVSKDARYDRLSGEIQPTIYLPFRQRLSVMGRAIYELRTNGEPLAYVNSVQQIVQRLDSRVPVSRITTQSSQIDQTIGRNITFARLCTAFAILALLIACVGLYGTVSYGVSRRTNELGIRMALGAQRKRVVWMVLRQVVAMVVIGLAVGLPAAYAAAGLIESFLFEMKPTDPAVLGASVAVLALAALMASFVPARRASRIDPMVALRHE